MEMKASGGEGTPGRGTGGRGTGSRAGAGCITDRNIYIQFRVRILRRDPLRKEFSVKGVRRDLLFSVNDVRRGGFGAVVGMPRLPRIIGAGDREGQG